MSDWYCPCPRCQIASWDFTQGDPTGPEWQPAETGWTWTPITGRHDGGYKLFVKAGYVFSVRFTVSLLDNLGQTFDCTLSVQRTGDRVFLIVGDTYTLAAGTLSGNPSSLTLGLCRRTSSSIFTALAQFYDGEGKPVATLVAPLGPATPPPSPNRQMFGQPRAELPGDATFVSLHAYHWPSTDTCCPPCPPDTCRRMERLYPRAWTPLALYGHANLHATLNWQSVRPDWAIFRIGTCCENGVGDVLQIDVALALKNVQLRFYNCSSYHGTTVIDLPFTVDWGEEGTLAEWSIDLCMIPSTTGLDLTVSMRGPNDTSAYVTRQLYTDWTYWQKFCWPEFEGDGDPSDVLAWATVFEIIHPQTTADGTVDVCPCFPVHSSGASRECVSVLCDEWPPPTIAVVAELENFTGAAAPYNGAYVMDVQCTTPVTTESTSAEGNQRPGDIPFVAAAVTTWMNQHFPGVTDPFAFPYSCDHYYCTAVTLTPLGWEAFELRVYWPAVVDPIYETLGLIPVMAMVTVTRDYFKGTTECNTAAQALLIGTANWPICPEYPEVTLNMLAHRERRCPSWTYPDTCDDQCNEPLAPITGGVITLQIYAL